MAVFNISGIGSHALTSGTVAVRLAITTIPAASGLGDANPANRYKIGAIRWCDGVAYWPAHYIQGGPEWLPVPTGASSISYHIFGSGVVEVTEVSTNDPLARAGTGSGGSTSSSFSSLQQLLVYDENVSNYSGTGWPSGTWQRMFQQKSFTPSHADAIVAAYALGYGAVGANPGDTIGRLLLDGATAKIVGGDAGISHWVNCVFTGWALFGPLTATAHTIEYQLRVNNGGTSNGAVWCQAQASPQTTPFGIRVLQLN